MIPDTLMSDMLMLVMRKSALAIVTNANKSQMAIDEFISMMRETLSDDQIFNMIENGDTQVVSKEVVASKNTLDKVGEQARIVAVQMGAEQRLDEEDAGEMYRWDLGSNHRHCPDCEAREGRIESLEDWKMIGTPKSGFSVCGGYCRCQLIPVKK